MLVSRHAGAGNQTWILWKSPVLLTTDPSLHPDLIFLPVWVPTPLLLLNVPGLCGKLFPANQIGPGSVIHGTGIHISRAPFCLCGNFLCLLFPGLSFPLCSVHGERSLLEESRQDGFLCRVVDAC